MTSPADLEPAARLLARLLLQELDRETLALLREPDVAAALAGVGIAAPTEDDLDGLAAEFFAAVLCPVDSAPPIESLWRDGLYESGSTAEVRQLAAVAGLELDRTAVRGAPPDHLGNLLSLWCETWRDAPAVAARIARDHLGFAPRAARAAQHGGGFYAQVIAAAAALAGQIRDTAV